MRLALVRIAATSDPNSGSDIENAPRVSRLPSRQETLLLLLGSVLAQHVRHDEMGVDDAGDAHPAAGQLFDAQRVGQQGFAEAAVLLGDHQTEQAHLPHLVDDFCG